MTCFTACFSACRVLSTKNLEPNEKKLKTNLIRIIPDDETQSIMLINDENGSSKLYLISPKTLPSCSVAKTILLFGPPTTSTCPIITMYISVPTSPYTNRRQCNNACLVVPDVRRTGNTIPQIYITLYFRHWQHKIPQDKTL